MKGREGAGGGGFISLNMIPLLELENLDPNKFANDCLKMGYIEKHEVDIWIEEFKEFFSNLMLLRPLAKYEGGIPNYRLPSANSIDDAIASLADGSSIKQQARPQTPYYPNQDLLKLLSQSVPDNLQIRVSNSQSTLPDKVKTLDKSPHQSQSLYPIKSRPASVGALPLIRDNNIKQLQINLLKTALGSQTRLQLPTDPKIIELERENLLMKETIEKYKTFVLHPLEI